jgi:CRISPR-associated protein Cst2
VFADDLLSDVYVGWVRGFAEEGRAALEQALDAEAQPWAACLRLAHPRQAFAALLEQLQANPKWLD